MLKLKELYHKIPPLFKNRYFIVTFLFLIWIAFLDENNLVLLNKRANTLESNLSEIDSLEQENQNLKEKLKRLTTDPEELEKFARENFLMKKPGEDIIIIRERSNE